MFRVDEPRQHLAKIEPFSNFARAPVIRKRPVALARFGKLVLLTFRSFHRWHRHHLSISLALLLISGFISGVGFFIPLRGWPGNVPEWAEALERGIIWFTVRFFLLYVVVGAIAKILARLWPPPVVSLLTTIAEPLHRPVQGHWIFGEHFGPKFRYRFASEPDLQLFVDYSIADPAILDANRELKSQERLALYTRWFSRSPKSFMALEEQGTIETDWTAIGVSIVLPLSKEGAEAVWTGRVRIIEIAEPHLCASNERADAVLIDTLIVKGKHRSRFPKLVYGLVFIHSSRFWLPRGRKQIEYWIEPDHKKLPAILRDSGFEGPHTIGHGHSLFKLIYPPLARRLAPRQKGTVDRIFDNLRVCHGWHIE